MFAPIERVRVKPNLALVDGAQLMDLAGDGQPDLVVLDGPMVGLYEHDGAEGWHPFRPFSSRLNAICATQTFGLSISMVTAMLMF